MKVPNFSNFDLQAIRRASGWLALGVSAILLLGCVALAQQEEKPKIPGLDKIIAANEHLAFTGTVKSVDEKHNILSIDSVEGGTRKSSPSSTALMCSPPTVLERSWTFSHPAPASSSITTNAPTTAR